MTTSSTNYTGLYSGGVTTPIPNTAYGNANVVSLLAAGTDGANTVGNITATGNIAVGNILTNGYYYANGVPFGGSGGSYGNSNVQAFLASGLNTANIITTANISGQYILGNGSQLTGLPATYGNANVATFLANFGSNSISTTGNVSAAYFAGNGSLLSNINAGNIVGAYGNANVVSLMANFGSNTISTTGNITGGNFVGSGAALSSITGANVSGTVANATYAVSAGSATTATSATTAGTVTTAAQPNITSVGTLTSITSTGNISTTGNVSAGFYIGNGSLLTNINGSNIVGGYGNANVVSLLSNFGSNTISTTGNITAGNIITPGTIAAGQLTANSSISLTGNITAATITATANLVSPTITTTGGAGNITGVNYVNANFFVGNGSGLTGLPATSPAGSNTQVQYNNNGVFGAVPTLIYNNSTGNVTIGNQAVNGNIVINTVAPDASVAQQPNRILVGTGYDGNYSANFDPLSMWRGGYMHVVNKYAIANADVNQTNRQFTSINIVDMNGGTLSSAARRIQGGTLVSFVGNGTFTATSNQWASVSGGGGALGVGNIGNIAMGNTTISHGVGAIQSVILGTNGNIGNSLAVSAQTTVLSATGTVTNAIGVAANFTGAPTTSPTTVIGYYMPNATATYGGSSSNNMRRATNYYFLKNDDDVAQSQLGSLRAYTEFNAVAGTTSGSLTIDKTAGQVQQVNLAGNITGITFSNFVSSASDGTNTDEQSDTVTIIFNQGSTGGYGVTFPSGSTFKYAGNVTTLQSTAANSVSLVSVSAIRISSTTTYLITISPGFV